MPNQLTVDDVKAVLAEANDKLTTWGNALGPELRDLIERLRDALAKAAPLLEAGYAYRRADAALYSDLRGPRRDRLASDLLAAALALPDQGADTPKSAREPSHSAGSSPAESGAVERVGPRVFSYTCDGCPALKTEGWREPSGDGETDDSGIYARCTAADRDMDTSYWSRSTRSPHWCPAPQPPDPQVSRPIRADLKSDVGELVTALEAADRIVETLVRSRRPYGYVIATVLPLDQELETFLRFRGASS